MKYAASYWGGIVVSSVNKFMQVLEWISISFIKSLLGEGADLACDLKGPFIFSLKQFILFSFPKMWLREASFTRKFSSLNFSASLYLCSCSKNTLICSPSSKTRDRTFPLDSHLASLWNSTAWCSALISSQTAQKTLVFSGLVFIKLTTPMMSVITSLNSEERCLVASACLYITQCVHSALGGAFLMSALSPFLIPDVVCAPSLQTAMQFSHFSSFSFRKQSRILNSSSAVALSLTYLQKKSRSWHREFITSKHT